MSKYSGLLQDAIGSNGYNSKDTMYRPFTPFPSGLYPRTDPESERVESEEDFCARLGRSWPNIPSQVAKQVFYDHGHFIDRWSWLDFRKLAFTRVDWGMESFEASGILQNATVRYFANPERSRQLMEREQRHEGFFKKHGTWPIPPLLLRVSDGPNPFPPWIEQSQPWLLVEGHRRLGLLLRLRDRLPVALAHSVWLGE
jgi:hypothetical protein